MRRFALVLSLFCVFYPLSAQSETVDWPLNPVVGLIGASVANGGAPLNSPLRGGTVAGGSYLDLTAALERHPQMDDYRVLSDFQAGSRSNDVPGTDWKGYKTQFDNLLRRATWRDGVPRLNVLIIEKSNDCIHTIPCTTEGVYALTDTIRMVAEEAVALGIKVVISDRPPVETVNLPLFGQTYGLPWVISAEGFAELRRIYTEELSTIEGAVYLDAWEGMSTIDGLHPDAESMREAAKLFVKTIKQLNQESD